MTIKALLLTLMVGLFFLIGMLIPRFFKNKNKLISFTTGLTFTIMLSLILLDLIPEIWEVLKPIDNPQYFLLIAIFAALGIIILKFLDLFVPEHHHNHEENEKNISEHNNHLFHIGLITAISLSVHNILEGITIYITGVENTKMGLLMAISVGLHNLPLGATVAAEISEIKNKNFLKFLISLLLILSSSLGALILFLINKDFSHILEGMLLSLTLGMLIYIVFGELLGEVKNNFHNKNMQYGILMGLIISFILLLI